MIELKIEHADLDAWIDRLGQEIPADELMLRRLKKRRLALRDLIVRLERQSCRKAVWAAMPTRETDAEILRSFINLWILRSIGLLREALAASLP